MKRILAIFISISIVVCMCACDTSTTVSSKEDMENINIDPSEFVGTYIGEDGSSLTFLSGGQTFYYYIDWEEIEQEGDWSYDKGRLSWRFVRTDGDIYAEVKDADTNQLRFVSDSIFKWSDETYTKVSDEDIKLTMPECIKAINELYPNKVGPLKMSYVHSDDIVRRDGRDTVSNVDDSENVVNNHENIEAVANTKVKVRKEPNTNCEVLGMLVQGEKVEVIEDNKNEWINVLYNGEEGYVKAEYLEITNIQDNKKPTTDNKTTEKKKDVEKHDYIVVSASQMFNDLDNNAYNAKEKYYDKYLEVTGYVASIDASGKYFGISNGDEFSFNEVQCIIKQKEQKDILRHLSNGQKVTVRGYCNIVGDILGYSIDLIEMK